jgi:hypothetical protein
MVDRFNSIHNDEYVDSYCGVNRVIGASFLMVTLSRQDKNRGNEMDRYTRFVTLCISAKKTPYLWNLARSGRFFCGMQLSEIYSDTNINLRKNFKRQEAVLSRMDNSLERRISRLTYHLIGIAIVYWFDRLEQSILKLSAQDFNRGPNCNCKHWSLPYTVYDFEDTMGN